MISTAKQTKEQQQKLNKNMNINSKEEGVTALPALSDGQVISGSCSAKTPQQ